MKRYIIIFSFVILFILGAMSGAAINVASHPVAEKHYILVKGNDKNFPKYCDTAWAAGYQPECNIVYEGGSPNERTLRQMWWKWE